jgi:deoxyribodipyrimidine photolyase-like uncharacterized protein
MKTLRFILGDQLTRGISSLDGLDKANDVVLMVEVWDETTYAPHHKQKIVLVLSAMRHFAEELRAEGIAVDYVKLGEPGNTNTFTGELGRAIARHLPDCVVLTEPSESTIVSLRRATVLQCGRVTKNNTGWSFSIAKCAVKPICSWTVISPKAANGIMILKIAKACQPR